MHEALPLFRCDTHTFDVRLFNQNDKFRTLVSSETYDLQCGIREHGIVDDDSVKRQTKNIIVFKGIVFLTR